MSTPTISAALALALAAVDIKNENHWTTDGQVRVDVVNAALQARGAPHVTRQDIIDAAPMFTRATAAEFQAQVETLRGEAEAALHAASPLGSMAGPASTSNPTPPAADAPTVAPRAALMAVLDVPLAQLFTSPDLLRQAVHEIDVRSQALVAQRREIEAELAALSAKADLCSRQLDRIAPRIQDDGGIQAYLKQQRATRAQRRDRALAFTAQGTTAKDVAATLLGPSMLDASMSRRKPGFGTLRPPPRMPAHIATAGAKE